jgi:uncharacterized repeat protein (TIGR01451 family)
MNGNGIREKKGGDKEPAAERFWQFLLKKIVEIVSGAGDVPDPDDSGQASGKKDDPCEKAPVLTPIAGVKLAWAMTGGFPQSNVPVEGNADASQATGDKKENASQGSMVATSAVNAEKMLACEAKTLPTDPNQLAYVRESTLAIRAAVRNLSTVYRGRELNLRENDVLRKVYLNAIKEDLSFVISLKNFTKALPGAVIAGGISLGFSLISQRYLGVPLTESDILIFTIIAAAFGITLFFFFNLVTRWRQKKFFVQRDHERTVYFKNYLIRSEKVLRDLYYELALKYQSCIDKAFTDFTPKKNPEEKGDGNYKDYDEIDLMLKSLYPMECEDADKCVYSWFFYPRWWIYCETRNCEARTKPKETTPKKTGSWWESVGDIESWWESVCTYKKWIYLSQVLSVIVGISLILIIFNVPSMIPWPSPSSVTLTKSPAAFALYQNQTINVSIVLNNTGSTDISDIIIDDIVPTAFIFESGNLTQSVVSLKPQESQSLQYTIRSRYTGNFTIPQARAVFTNSSGDSHAILSNTPVYEVLSADQPPVNVSISKSVSPALLGENETLVVRVTFYNTGNAIVSNLTLSDLGPEDFTFISGNRTLYIPSLKAAESRSIKYTLRSGYAGTFILNPAKAQFNNSRGNFTFIESESPIVQVRSDYSTGLSPGISSATQNAFNITEFFVAWKAFLGALPSNTTA